MKFETVVVETHNAVARIRLSRPKAMNALSSELVEELDRALDPIGGDSTLRVLAITGSAAAFCAGADLAFARGSSVQGESARGLARLLRFTERWSSPTAPL